MTATTALAVTALVASVVLLKLPKRVYPVVAVLVSALQLAMTLGVLSLSVKALPLPLVLGAALLIAGALAFMHASEKAVVAAATLVTAIGALQVLAALKIF
jgi:hypothetical protein